MHNRDKIGEQKLADGKTEEKERCTEFHGKKLVSKFPFLTEVFLLCHTIKINIQTPGSDHLYYSFSHGN